MFGKLIGKLICKFRGHKRGVRVSGERAVEALPLVMYQCPRCSAIWSRKAKP